MLHINGALIVEGKYDKIHLSGVVDCPIIVTNGFSVFKNEETKSLIKWYANHGGITILTDSDSAGFKIRGYIKGIVPNGTVKNVYIPDIFGKEKRKLTPSAEGKLGVEGVDIAILKEAFEKAGVIGTPKPSGKRIERIDLFEDGFFGGKDSSAKRAMLLKKLDLPEKLSTSGLLDILNTALTYDEYKKLANEQNDEL
ncbi:MAG: DUF4093 domain-containing protein [Oscillospiraceae bacterium]|nr:DUF4093 domain-containing protein [Oscillospiraceae bacterium]